MSSGVETVKSESASGKLTVTGAVDPAKLREKLEEKTKKKVDLISPQPKKEKEKDNNKDKNKGDEDKIKEKKPDNEKKPKEVSKIKKKCSLFYLFVLQYKESDSEK